MTESADGPGEPSRPRTEAITVPQISARVPEQVQRGALSTGVLTLSGNTEFVVDFAQSFGQPPEVVARVIMPYPVLSQFIEALRTNLERYTNQFGPPPGLPQPKPNENHSARDPYDELKVPDSLLSGAYANGVMIGHTASEFRLDFLTNLPPHSAVSSRVFLSAPQVPRLLSSLEQAWEQVRNRVQRPKPPEDPGAKTDTPENKQ